MVILLSYRALPRITPKALHFLTSDISDVKKCNAFGVILGKALYDNKITIEEAKKLA